MGNDIKYRCYRFSVAMIKYLRSKQWDSFSTIVAKQLMRSTISVGANVIEGGNSSTRTEFKRYYEIALKSGNETKYWICILRDGFDNNDEELKKLLVECEQLCKILASSIISLKKNTEKTQQNIAI